MIYVFSLVLLSPLVKLESAIIIDPDVKDKNGLALKQYAQRLKGLPVSAAHHRNLVTTDTDELIKGIGSDNSAYIAFVEIGLKKALRTWIETCLLPGADDLLFTTIKGVGVRKLHKTSRSDFIAKLNTVIDGATSVAPPTPNASLRSLKATRTAILNEFATEVETWIKELSPLNKLFLRGPGVNGVLINGATNLVSRSRDDFITAIKAKIISF